MIDVLRKGIKHGALSFDLFYGKPSPENAKAMESHAKNRFSITRQLRLSNECPAIEGTGVADGTSILQVAGDSASLRLSGAVSPQDWVL